MFLITFTEIGTGVRLINRAMELNHPSRLVNEMLAVASTARLITAKP
jgi:hypothetical protein